MVKPLIAANWKMHKTITETKDFLVDFLPGVTGVDDVEIVIAPPFTSLSTAAELLRGSNVVLAAQNLFWEDHGAYTGEISGPMLKDIGCEYVIVGHSERRQYFGETDETINRKLKAVQRNALKPILCVGETLEQREKGITFDVVEKQLTEALKDINPGGLVVAYEPVWAIGTGRTATPEQAEEIHAFISERLQSIFGDNVEGIRIIYGGSVKPENIKSLMDREHIEGALVGGASLKVESFTKIVRYKEQKEE